MSTPANLPAAPLPPGGGPWRAAAAVRPSPPGGASLPLLTALRRAVDRVLGPEVKGERSYLIVNGWRMDLASVTALVFEEDADRPALVAKGGRGEGASRIEAEGANLERLARASDPAFRRSVPRRLALERGGDTAVLVESVARGAPFDPGARPQELQPVLEAATDWLLAFHAATGCARRPLPIPDVERLLVLPLAAYLQRFEPGPAERALLGRAMEQARGLAGRPLPLVAQHDDLCAQNLFWDGRDVEVIDWEAPLEPNLPAFDLIHLLASAGARPSRPGRSDLDGYAGFERAFFGRSALSAAARSALERYGRALGLDREVLRLIFAVYWADYAVQKERLTGTPGPGRPPGAEGIWSLARIQDGSCLNVRRLAEDERSFVLR